MPKETWPQDPDTSMLFPTHEEELSMLLESIPPQRRQEELRQKGQAFLKTLSPPERGGRAPDIDEMGAGEIYASGGYEGQAPSYTIEKPRQDVQEILSESGYQDFMTSRDLKKRQKHVKKLKDITGVSKIENEDDFIYGPGGKSEQFDIQRMKGVERWLKTSPEDRMMITQVAKGELEPEQFRAIKTQQEMAKEQQVLKTLSDIAGQIPARGGYTTKEGVETPMTAEGIGDFVRGERGAGLGFEGSTSTVRNISSGGRQGGGGGKVPPLPVSNLEKEINDNLKILKGHTVDTPKFKPEVYKKAEEDNSLLRTALELQKRAGGVLKKSDEQVKAEAPQWHETADILNEILLEYDRYPTFKKGLSDPKEAAYYFKDKLAEMPDTMYNRVIGLINQGVSLENIYKTITDVTGQKRISLQEAEEKEAENISKK